MVGLYDFKDEEQIKEYLDQVAVEYHFDCYHEKRPDGCHRLADYLEAFNHDYRRARTVYAKNCNENRYGASCLKLARYFLLGRGGSKDEKLSLDAYQRGCDYGNGTSCYGAASLHQKTEDFVTASQFFQRGCELNDIPSCNVLSCYHITGKTGIPKDMQKAFKFAMKACENDYVPACINVGVMYSTGEGVEKNSELGQKYKDKAKALHQSGHDHQKGLKFGE